MKYPVSLDKDLRAEDRTNERSLVFLVIVAVCNSGCLDLVVVRYEASWKVSLKNIRWRIGGRLCGVATKSYKKKGS